MKTKIIIILIALISFSCKNESKKTDDNAAESETKSEEIVKTAESEAAEEEDLPLAFCNTGVFAFTTIDPYNAQGVTNSVYNIPYGIKTILGTDYQIRPEVVDRYNISTQTDAIILELRAHGAPYYLDLCNESYNSEPLNLTIQDVITGFNPSDKADVAYFIYHDEDFASASQNYKDRIINEIRQELNNIPSLSNNLNDSLLAVLNKLITYPEPRPKTLGGGVIPPK